MGALVPLAGLLTGVGVWAYFSSGGVGSAQGSVATLSSPGSVTPTVPTGLTTVSVTWTASTLSNSSPVDGYYVTRKNTSTNVTSAACATSAASLTTSTSCIDTGVSNGTYTYTAVAVFRSWTATGTSGSVTVTADAIAPTVSASAIAATTGTSPAGYVKQGGTYVVYADASDTGGSGLATVTANVSNLTTGATSVALTACSSSCTIGGHTYGFKSGQQTASNPVGEGSKSYGITATDGVANHTTQNYTVTVDNTPPATTDDSASTGSGWFKTTKTVTLSPTDSSSGVASTYHTSDGSTPTTGSSTGTSVSLVGDGIYSVKYFSTDNVGDQESVETAATAIHIDETAPTPATIGTSGAYTSGGTTYIKNGQALTDAATDATVNGASSGVTSVAYKYCSGAGCTPATSIGSSSTGPNFSVTWSSQPADGSYRLMATVTDAAGNTANSAITAVTVDNSPPATSDNTASIGSGWFNVTKTVTLSPNDTGSGAASTYYTSDGTTPTTSSSSGTSVSLASDGIYTVKYLSTDNLGNTESVKTAGTAIHIDKTTPTPATIGTTGAYTSGGTTYVKNGEALTDAATDGTVNGASSGVSSVAYKYCSVATDGSSCTPATSIGSSSTGSSYSVTWSSQPADGSYRLLAVVTDAAGNTANSGITTVTVDNTGPTVTTALADSNANGGGFINGAASFYAYANVSDAGSGVDTSTITADLSAQCSSCTAVTLSSTGGPFTIYTSSGAVTYTYRSALKTSVTTPTASFSVTAKDNLVNSTAQSGTVAVDSAGNPGNPASVTLTTGSLATAYNTCSTSNNAWINAANGGSETVTVTTASTSATNDVVKLTISTLTFYKVVSSAGAATVTFSGLDLSGLSDGAVTLSAIEYSPGGNGVSGAKTQATSGKDTAGNAATAANFTYTDNNTTTADQVTGAAGAGPGAGFLAFAQTAGTHSGSTAFSAQLAANGSFAKFALFAETSGPTYSVTSFDAACNLSSGVSWSPTDTK